MDEPAFARLRRGKPAFAPAAMATVQPCRAVAASSAVAVAAKEDAAKSEKKSEKSEKWFLAIFHLQPAAAQLVPTKTGSGHFSDFSKNSRGYTGGATS